MLKDLHVVKGSLLSAMFLQVVIAMRDLFQVVFELKKKEIELTKQHLEQNAMNVIKFHTTGIFVEPTPDTKVIVDTSSR